MKHSKILQFLLPPLICALLCAGIPSVLILTGHGEPIRTAVNTILSPIRGVFSDAGDGIRDISAYITEFDALKAENERQIGRAHV